MNGSSLGCGAGCEQSLQGAVRCLVVLVGCGLDGLHYSFYFNDERIMGQLGMLSKTIGFLLLFLYFFISDCTQI